MNQPTYTVNDRIYETPKTCAVAICIDGCEPDYFDEAIKAGVMPNLKRIKETGTDRISHCVVPSFTNPNNLSIATGRPPSVHGICGNFVFVPETGEEVMMNDAKFLRAPTIFQTFADAGKRVMIVTAKDKLRTLLGFGLDFSEGKNMCFSAEKSGTSTVEDHGMENASKWLGMPVPDVYSAELSEFVFAAGVKLLKEEKPDILYLTTTDYVQHKHAPGTPKANEFYAMYDKYLGELDALGAAIIMTGDHGMNAKHKVDGTPDVIYLQDLLDGWLGEEKARVILPITDPYVVHHGALGSYATTYLQQEVDREALIDQLNAKEGIMTALSREAACEKFELPPDRVGDIVIVSDKNVVLGTSEHRHDLSGLTEPLRSHGGISEQRVPFIMNRVIDDLPNEPVLRNFDAYHYVTKAAAQENSN
ncbi:MAG: phosphonoacetate hydrolase [Saprospiraceae bacterium]|jgi:phosphonoacetate hydrolase